MNNADPEITPNAAMVPLLAAGEQPARAPSPPPPSNNPLITQEALTELMLSAPDGRLTTFAIYVEDTYETYAGDGFYEYEERRFLSLHDAVACIAWLRGHRSRFGCDVYRFRVALKVVTFSEVQHPFLLERLSGNDPEWLRMIRSLLGEDAVEPCWRGHETVIVNEPAGAKTRSLCWDFILRESSYVGCSQYEPMEVSDFPANASFWLIDDEIPFVRTDAGWLNWLGGSPVETSPSGLRADNSEKVSFERFAKAVEKSRRV